MSKTALITGITGQDGSLLAELLLEKGYEVHGVVRRISTPNFSRIEHIRDRLILHGGDMTDAASLSFIVSEVGPDEVYNLAAQSFVADSFTQPLSTFDINGTGTLRLLEAISRHAPHARFYQASTSEMFGKVVEEPQSELTPFRPRSPYAVAKVAAHYATVNYRESYDMFACCGILFNHESPRRGLEFVTRKITHAATRIAFGLQRELRLGNLDALRDWGHARDYVRAMWTMLQADEPDDYVVATGERHSVREFCAIAFDALDLDYRKYVKVDPQFLRPAEVATLCGDSSKIRQRLGWQPEVSFGKLVYEMIEHDCELAEREKAGQAA